MTSLATLRRIGSIAPENAPLVTAKGGTGANFASIAAAVVAGLGVTPGAFGLTLLDDTTQGAAQTTIGYTAADVLTKLLTVDGAGSGLDADKVDGVQTGTSGATIPLLNAANTWSATQCIQRSSQTDNIGMLQVESTTSNGNASVTSKSDKAVVQMMAWEGFGSRLGVREKNNGGAGSLYLTTGNDAVAAYLDGTSLAAIFYGAVTAPVAVSSETSGTLTSASRNRHINCSGGITLPNSVFSANDKITFAAGSAARTFTRGSGIAMYVNGTDSASATLASRQLGGAHWESASVVYLTGAFT